MSVFQLTAGRGGVEKLNSVGSNRRERSCKSSLEVVGSDGSNFNFAVVAAAAGFATVRIVSAVVSSGFVVIVVVKDRRSVRLRLKVQEQVGSLGFIPSECLLSGSRVNGRAGSHQLQLFVIDFTLVVAHVVTIAPQNEILDGTSLLSVCHIFQSLFGN